ncbi:MAG: hypothetical protein WCF84_26090, partial [Anaerolineae bacterium]
VDGLNTGLNGIRFLSGGSLTVENVHVQEFTQVGIDYEPNQAGNSQLFVSDSLLQNNAGGGVLVKPAGGGLAKASLVRVNSILNLFGVRAEDSATVTVNDSTASQNSSSGFLAVSTTLATSMFIDNSIAASNGTAATDGGINAIGTLAKIRISNVTTTDNQRGLTTSSHGSILSFGNNLNSGNASNGTPSGTLPLQ